MSDPFMESADCMSATLLAEARTEIKRLRAEALDARKAFARSSLAKETDNERLRSINAELVEACEAALNMVDGDGMPPDWYLLRAAIARAKP